jgi:hypothetical protein
LESLNDSSDEDEEDNSEASSEATIDPKHEWFGNSSYSPKDYFLGLEDL